MSVERIAPLRQSTLEIYVGRGGALSTAHEPQAPFPPPAGPAPDPPETRGPLFDSISLPLPRAAPELGGLRASPGASYAMEASQADLPQLQAGSLPLPLIVNKARSILHAAAAERNTTIESVIDKTGVVKGDRLPSRNEAEAQSTFRTSVLARGDDEETRAFDIHLTRVGARQWEAAVFPREKDRADQGFPYPTPPISVERLVIDPSNGQILACVAQHLAPREFAPQLDAQTGAFIAEIRAIVAAIVLVLATYLVARSFSVLMGVGFFVTAVSLLIRIPAASRTRRKGVTPSRRRRW